MSAHIAEPSSFEITIFEKDKQGPLTKKIWLENGKARSDGSPCSMARGSAQRFCFSDLHQLSSRIVNMRACEALSLGALIESAPNRVAVVTAAKINGADNAITRTLDYLGFREAPSLALLDFDLKGMPDGIRAKITDYWQTIIAVAPTLANANRLARASTSAGLYRADNGERLPNCAGQHVYVAVRDGTDIGRFLKDLHARCWLAGFGWIMLGAAGQFLVRSIVDITVGSPERLVFEGPPQLQPPLLQDAEMRRPQVFDGDIIDTLLAVPPLSADERRRYDELVAAAKATMQPEADRVRALYVEARVAKMVERGVAEETARRTLEQLCGGVLLPPIVLPWDDPAIADKTVADVLAKPGEFAGKTLADPIEGTGYGRNKAKVFVRADGSVVINSLAHGISTVFRLRYDFDAALSAVLAIAKPRDAVRVMVRCVLNGELSPTEFDKLITETVKHTKFGKVALKKEVEQARQAKIKPPAGILVLGGFRHENADAGLAALHAANVPFYQRNRALVRVASVPAKASDGTRVEVPAIVRVELPLLGRELGKHADWVTQDENGKLKLIDPPKAVVEQIAVMSDEWPFPALVGIVATPTLRLDGSLLATPGYDEATGLVLFNPPPMEPIAERPSKAEALEALALLDELLHEFPFVVDEDKEETSRWNPSRSVALSMLITPVVRGALAPAVPLHAVSAPEPGTGKSYLLDISSAIAVGARCAVLTVAPKAEETEKRLIGAAIAGRPIIALDNVSRLVAGDFLCQVIERPLLQIRPLGTSDEIIIPNAFTCFVNGNNMEIHSDVVRRTIKASLDANVENPEDREFKADPFATILADRGRYVRAALTVCRAYIANGKPDRLKPLPSFEAWSDIVRSALVWLGRPDPVLTMSDVRSRDPVRQGRARLLCAWRDYLGEGTRFLVGELIARADVGEGDFELRDEFRNALLSVAGDRRDETKINNDRLGRWLAAAEDNVIEGVKLRADRTTTRVWWLVERA
jgi:hypothetical protein